MGALRWVWTQNRRLRVGERIRLTPHTGRIYRVKRVNDCAAYLQPSSVEGKLVEFGDRSFLAMAEGKVIAISPRAFVERVES